MKKDKKVTLTEDMDKRILKVMRDAWDAVAYNNLPLGF